MQFHRYATAGPLSLCPVVVVKVYIATVYGRCNYGMWWFQVINNYTLILLGSTSSFSSHICVMKMKVQSCFIMRCAVKVHSGVELQIVLFIILSGIELEIFGCATLRLYKIKCPSSFKVINVHFGSTNETEAAWLGSYVLIVKVVRCVFNPLTPELTPPPPPPPPPPPAPFYTSLPSSIILFI